jgi:hypothetical protein
VKGDESESGRDVAVKPARAAPAAAATERRSVQDFLYGSAMHADESQFAGAAVGHSDVRPFQLLHGPSIGSSSSGTPLALNVYLKVSQRTEHASNARPS